MMIEVGSFCHDGDTFADVPLGILALYFLLAKTLEASPFASAAAALKEALSNSEV
jgi:hypothetical protein